jgi:histidyl-tRNA synthetase
MVQAIRGMRDVLPDEGRRWRLVESALESVLLSYAYEEVHLPLLEFTELFSRGVGEATDIVEKEMYNFPDRDGDSISLRPEGTAGCVRVLQQHGLLYNQTQRVFYRGPMFRYERPQKGRYRQFYQMGAEAFGMPGPDVDAELLALGRACWERLGIEDRVRLELNTLGSAESRATYRDALVRYLEGYADELDADSRRRLDSNPLRILDSKVERTREILVGAPDLSDYLDDEGRSHFDRLREMLAGLGIDYVLNPRLVRGLDYYNHTVFEWVTDDLGSQGTICAGGRYDGLVAQLGGRPTPGAGFALGLERVLLLHEQRNLPTRPAADVYVCMLSEDEHTQALALADRLRRVEPELRIRVHAGGGKLKNQLKRADQCGAAWAVILGADELAQGKLTLKALATGEQVVVTPDAAAALIAESAPGAGANPREGADVREGADPREGADVRR